MRTKIDWTCKVCGEIFRTRRLLQIHLNEALHGRRKLYSWKCDKCGNIFRTCDELKAHKSKEHKRISNYEWKCNYCGEVFETRRKLVEHNKICEIRNMCDGKKQIHKVIRSIHECPHCKRVWETTESGFKNHVMYCYENPDKKEHRKFKFSEESRKKLSESMKRAAEEGRTHRFDSSKKSYPEEWMTDIIENEFSDNDYEYNFHVNRYRLDFAWPKKMRYIEIDGDQHYISQSRINHDIERSKILKDLGWTELRLSWSFIQKNRDESICMMKDFIDDISDLPLELQYNDKRKEYYENLQKLKSENPDKINKIGRYCPIKITDNELENFRVSILSSGIDITKYGWKKKVCDSTGISKKRINMVISKFPNDFKSAYKDAHVKL